MMRGEELDPRQEELEWAERKEHWAEGTGLGGLWDMMEEGRGRGRGSGWVRMVLPRRGFTVEKGKDTHGEI